MDYTELGEEVATSARIAGQTPEQWLIDAERALKRYRVVDGIRCVSNEQGVPALADHINTWLCRVERSSVDKTTLCRVMIDVGNAKLSIKGPMTLSAVVEMLGKQRKAGQVVKLWTLVEERFRAKQARLAKVG